MKKDIRSLELEVNLLHERICSALGDTKRIMILYLLAEKDMFVNEISEALNTPQSTISRHLGVLRQRSMVSTERRGTAVLYSLLDERIIKVLDLMRDILKDQIQAEAVITKSIPESS
jgi:ArsR family transcriptional regulator